MTASSFDLDAAEHMAAWVLVQTNVGTAAAVAAAAAALPGVFLAEDVTGPYDVIIRLDAAGSSGFTEDLRRLQQLPGVARTLTCHIGPDR